MTTKDDGERDFDGDLIAPINDLETLWRVEFENQITYREEQTGIDRGKFMVSGGTKTRELEDIAWWETQGFLMVDRWLAWQEREQAKVWKTPDGRLAIELDIVADLGRNVIAKSVVDRVMVSADGSLGIVDLKSGNSAPDSPLQIAIAKVAVEAKYDLAGAVKWGLFFKARQHKQYVIDLKRWTIPLVRNILLEYAKLRPVQAFPPRLGRHCNWCGVHDYCAAYGGTLSHTADPTDPEYEGPRF